MSFGNVNRHVDKKCFKVDLSGRRPFSRSQYYNIHFSGDRSVKAMSRFLIGQLSNKRKIHLMNSSTAGVKRRVEDVVKANLAWTGLCNCGGTCN